ncbi:MAG: hypothetical protein ACI39F_03750 [Acutalibacteraceae bacterium]
MGLFRKRKKLENPEVLQRINQRAIKYVTTRNEDGTEYVLGHSGSINIKGDELICFSEGRDVFRCNVYEAKVGELLSKDGVRLAMKKDDGSEYAVIAYYVYRR